MKQERRRGYAITLADARDASLRGRTYAIPFDTVWQAALALAGGGLRRWQVSEHDDQEGVILAVSRTLTGNEHDIMIRITLDADAQTRVDASAQARKPRSDLGRARRRLRRFFKALDRRIERQMAPAKTRR